MSYNSNLGYFLKDEEFLGFYYELYIKEVLHREKTPFQSIGVVDTVSFGKVLITDGIVMISEMDEVIYHEMMVHVPMSLVNKPRKVLIIGGGDGGCAREVSKYSSVEHIDLVEIDSKVVEITQKYFDTWKKVDYTRLSIYFEDGFKFLEKSKDKYDVIILDISAPIDIAKDLYSRESFEKVVSMLSDEGVFVIQSESMFLTPNVPKHIINQVKDIIKYVGVYWIYVPSFLSPWSFVIGSKVNPPSAPVYENLSIEELNNMKYYSREIHKSSFVIPQFIRDYIESSIDQNDMLNRDILKKLLKNV